MPILTTLGLYCGSFDPFHVGHLNIVQKAERLFDDVIIASGTNPDKHQTIPKSLGPNKPYVDLGLLGKRYTHIGYYGFTTELIKHFKKHYGNVFLVRGIRSSHDYDYEMDQIQTMQALMGDQKIQVVLLPCDREFEHVSSSTIRKVSMFDKEAAKQWLPFRDN